MNMKFALVSIKDTVNTGDKACSPYHYFDFEDAGWFDLKDSIPEADIVIYGGGAIEPKLRTEKIHHRVSARCKVAWGIGTSRSGRKNNLDLVDDLDLCGVREYNRDLENNINTSYVPCVSCMSPLLDIPYKEDMEVAIYEHGAKSNLPEFNGIPKINNRAPFDEAIEFIGRSQYVITNSFHGTYWALLLGKKVICFPFSSKFYGYKYSPYYATEDNWKDAFNKAKSYPSYLEECRVINRDFYERILSL